MNPSIKLSICLFSDPNFLAVDILEILLSKNCVVNVVTNKVKTWKEKTAQLLIKNRFSVIETKDFDKSNPYDYAIFCGGFIESRTAYSDFADFVSSSKISKAKTLAIFPFDVFDRGLVDRIKMSGNLAIIFIGDLLGPRINLESNLIISRAFSEIFWKRKLTLPVGEVFYPVFVADAARAVVKWLFSFGPYGKIIFVLGNQTSGDAFWNANRRLIGQLELEYDSKMVARIMPKGFETEFIESDLNFTLREMYKWLASKRPERPGESIKKRENGTTRYRKYGRFPKGVKNLLLLLSLIFIFPFLTLLVSLFMSFISYKSLVGGNGSSAVNSFLLARTFAVVSEKESNVLGYVPFIGLIYKETKFAAVFAEETDNFGTHAVPVIKDTTQLFESILGTQVYNSTDLSWKIESEMALINNDLVSMKTLTEDASQNNVILANKILGKVDFERFITLISECRILAGSAPQILGQDKSKTYLVLFENNMELRPTGGFIGSFGLITFSGGRLTDLTVNDVYSADGQLNGHVEPPAPIKNYLGEANWWLRDSNWDPDFPTSAKRAEWFLDKELSEQVDGVAAVDLFPIREILKSTGAVFLPDYNLSITSDNLYEETQSEVQNGFFPGTHQKASFLTALCRSLLSEIIKLKANQKLNIIKTLYEGLDGRHIQIYLHDNSQQDAVSALGWDGAVTSLACGANCYTDLVGDIEANVGDNKANYFIKRNMSLDLTIGPSQIERKLTVNLEDTANPALGPSGKYKDYLRIFIPSDASLISVKSIEGSMEQDLSPEITDAKGHREVGVLVELLAGERKSIEFVWTSSAPNNYQLASYGLLFRKQAGTDADKVNINIKGNVTIFEADPRFTLTRMGTYGYNTTLARDLFSRFSW